MASLQVNATPEEDVVITETEATNKLEPQVVAPAPMPPPPEMMYIVNVEDEENFEDFTAPPYDEKVEKSENEEEKDIEYSPFIEREEAPAYRYAWEPATFGDFDEDEDDATN